MRGKRRRDHWKPCTKSKGERQLANRSPSGESPRKFEDIFDKIGKTVVDDRGRIYIPRYIRRQLGIKEGDRLLISVVDDCLEIYTRKSFKRPADR